MRYRAVVRRGMSAERDPGMGSPVVVGAGPEWKKKHSVGRGPEGSIKARVQNNQFSA